MEDPRGQHLPEYRKYIGGFEISLLPELKHLHDTGYNSLTYKLRNCGRSGEGNAEIQREIRWPPGLRSFCGGTLIQRGRCDDRAKLFQQLAVMLTQVTCYRLISN